MNDVERRKEDAGPPTQLIQAYEKWSPRKRKMMAWLGVGILVFTVVLPLVAGIWVDLPAIYWAFASIGLVTGLAMISPELAVFILGAVKAVLPVSTVKRLLTKPERRNGDDEEGQG